MKNIIRSGAMLLALLTNLVPLARAQSLPEAGRNLLKRHEHSLWTVEIQLRQTITHGEQSAKQEGRTSTAGILVDVGNLIAVPLSALDPGPLMRASNPQAAKLQFESEVVAVKVQLPDGGELPATVIYRDKDLDLAFVMPKEALPKDAVPLRLAESGKPGVLDTVIMLGHAGVLRPRTLMANAGYIQAVLDKPQLAYLYEQAGIGSVGCPVFLPDGKLVGLVALHFVAAARPDGSEGSNVFAWVLPAETVRQAALQAEAARQKTAEPAK